jgi:O-antigen/teichoic acid export membrane protein
MSDAPAPPIPPQRPVSTIRRDLISAYAASLSRIASWIFISAVLFRFNPLEFAMFALIRSTIGLLNYTALGMSPAVVRMIAQECARRAREFDESSARPVEAASGSDVPVLNYQPPRRGFEAALPAYSNGIFVAVLLGLIALALLFAYQWFFDRLHATGGLSIQTLQISVMLIGSGIIVRLLSDVAGAVIQAAGRIDRDCWLIVATEGVWVGVFLMARLSFPFGSRLEQAGLAFLLANLYLAAARWWIARLLMKRGSDLKLVNSTTIWNLISFGSLVTIAQLADFLYAPTDYILINRLLGADLVAVYAPAVQMDAALLLSFTAISTVLFPRAALASAKGNATLLRQYYLRGTLISGGLMLVASFGAWMLSPWIFRGWLGSSLPETRAILPLVLIHTVVGGSSAVGRSILLGMGKVKPFTAAVLVAGISNVLLSFVFVRYLELGLRGIIFGTLIAVIGRCAIWMPWYVLRELRRSN